MRAFVFTDKALAKHAGQFVWLSIDTEKARNAPFTRKFPIRAWPTFYVIDSAPETVALRWVGGATVPQLEKILADGARAAGGVRRGVGEALAKADALYGEGKYAEAEKAYAETLALVSPKAPRYARAAESRLFCLQATNNQVECVALAREALPALRHTASAANLAGSGLECALGLPAGTPGRSEAVAALEVEARAVVKDGAPAFAADDLSAVYGSLVSAREDARDPEGAKAVAREWVACLDGEAARAKTPEQRTALDPNRLSAFEAAGEVEKAIPMLEASERDFPEDYNPPARLALAFLELKRYGEALAASDRALACVYGPRTLRVLAVREDIYKGMGDAAAARKTAEDALTYAEALPPGQRSDVAITSLMKRLEAVGP